MARHVIFDFSVVVEGSSNTVVCVQMESSVKMMSTRFGPLVAFILLNSKYWLFGGPR